jgi:hypothetical protein
VAKVRFQIELTNKDGFPVMGVVAVEVSIPKNRTPVLDMLGIGEQERANLIGQKIGELSQLLGFDPDGVSE